MLSLNHPGLDYDNIRTLSTKGIFHRSFVSSNQAAKNAFDHFESKMKDSKVDKKWDQFEFEEGSITMMIHNDRFAEIVLLTRTSEDGQKYSKVLEEGFGTERYRGTLHCEYCHTEIISKETALRNHNKKIYWCNNCDAEIIKNSFW